MTLRMQITLSGPVDEETQKLVVVFFFFFLGAQFEKENRERKLNEEDNYGGIEEKREAFVGLFVALSCSSLSLSLTDFPWVQVTVLRRSLWVTWSWWVWVVGHSLVVDRISDL